MTVPREDQRVGRGRFSRDRLRGVGDVIRPWSLARVLFDAGRLTIGAHRSLSSYAMQFDTITKAAASGKQVRGSWFAQLDKARKELGLDDLDRPIAAPQGARVNRYARTGFANRR